MHIEGNRIREAGRSVLVFSGIVGIALFILLLIFGVITGLAYLVEVLYR